MVFSAVENQKKSRKMVGIGRTPFFNFKKKKLKESFANSDLSKSTLCMNSCWLGTAEVSHKKAHILVEVEMSSHLFFYKLK